MSKKLFILLVPVVLAIALFPFGWLGKRLPAFNLWLTWFFPEPWGHVIAHAIIFFLVGSVLWWAWPLLQSKLWLYLGLILTVAIGQEAIQLLYKHRPVVLNDITDLIPDLLGAGLAFFIWRLRVSRLPASAKPVTD